MQALVFDFDGTLVDTETPEFEVWQEVFAEHGVAMPEGFWSNLVGRGAEQEVERPRALLERLTGRPFEGDRLRHDRTMAMIRQAPLRPGVLALLDAADSEGLPCAVASSSRHDWVDPGLGSRNVAHRFETVLCADDVVRAKPFPDLYLEACRRLDADPEWTVALEDSPNGLAAAKSAGLFAVATPNPATRDLDLAAADLLVEDLTAVTLDALRQALVQRKHPHGRLSR